jgi:restriction system protein
MARRSGFLHAVVKASEAAARQHAVAQRQQAVAAARLTRERARQGRQQLALEHGAYVLHQAGQADTLNADLAEQIDELTTLLSSVAATTDAFDFATLKHEPDTTQFNPGKLAIPESSPPAVNYLVPNLEGVHALLPWARRAHDEATGLAKRRYDDDMRQHREREVAREKTLADVRAGYERTQERLKQEAEKWNAQVDEFESNYADGSPAAISDMCRLVLEHSDYPGAFPKSFELVYMPDSRQLVVQYDCPSIDVVPEIVTYKYVKSKNQITTTLRPANQRRALYVSVVAQVTLRTLH